MEELGTMSADTAKLLLGIMAIISLAVITSCAVVSRKDKFSLFSCLGALISLYIATSLWNWNEWEFLALLFIEAATAGMIAYLIMRSYVNPLPAGIIGILNCIAATLATGWLTKSDTSIVLERGNWMLLLLPTGVFTAIAIGFIAVFLSRNLTRGDVMPGSATDEEERLIVKMLTDGKISPYEASALLKTMGGAAPRDTLPLAGPERISLVGGLFVALGFMLPWVFHNFPPEINRIFGSLLRTKNLMYQTGIGFGFFGWLILILGLLPAILTCLPVLDRYIRQGLFRLVAAGTGSAFIISLIGPQFLLKKRPAIGLLIVFFGFLLQLASALKQSGFLKSGQEATPE